MPDMIPPGCYPLLLVLYTLKCLIFPLRTRGPLWSAIREVITAPLTSPNFFHTYVADVFTSMIKVFQDIAWAIVFIVSGDFWVSENQNYDMDPHHWQHKIWFKNILIPLVCLFPLWIRFNQCLRRYMDTKKRLPNQQTPWNMPCRRPLRFLVHFIPSTCSTKKKFDSTITTARIPSSTKVQALICFKSFGWVCSSRLLATVLYGTYIWIGAWDARPMAS